MPEIVTREVVREAFDGPGGFGSVDARLLGWMRCALALSALIIIWVDPAEPQRLVALTYGSLAAYCLYSIGLVIHGSRPSDRAAPSRALHWIDVAFFAWLVALTAGTSSIFFYFFFYAILVASFGWGFREGLAVSAASFAAFATVGLTFAPAGDDFELNRTLIRAVYLFVFGYMIAYWGGFEGLLRRRLGLLREINAQWNPRLGAGHAVVANLARLREFYDADSCVLVVQRPQEPPGTLMYSETRSDPSPLGPPVELTKEAARPLLQLPGTVAAFFHDPSAGWLARLRGHSSWDLNARSRTRDYGEACQALVNLLDAPALATVPYEQRDGALGRIYVTRGTGGFGQSDLEFLSQASAALSTVVENMQLMDALVSRAAENERASIARDLHDTTIQPYIGLKLALDALQRDAGADNPLVRRIAELNEMAGATIHDLRNYAASFRDRSALPGEALVAAVKKQGERFSRFYGIDVDVTSGIIVQPQGRIAAEAFQIVSEGLSNVMRHTTAKRAFVSVRTEDSSLMIEIGNEAGERAAGPETFTPRSIGERAKALGGSASVATRPDGYTVVHVTIPL